MLVVGTSLFCDCSKREKYHNSFKKIFLFENFFRLFLSKNLSGLLWKIYLYESTMNIYSMKMITCQRKLSKKDNQFEKYIFSFENFELKLSQEQKIFWKNFGIFFSKIFSFLKKNSEGLLKLRKNIFFQKFSFFHFFFWILKKFEFYHNSYSFKSTQKKIRKFFSLLKKKILNKEAISFLST